MNMSITIATGLNNAHTYPEIVVQRAIIHELHDNHDWLHLGDDTIQLDDIGMIELTHNGSLCQKVITHLV